MSRKNVNEFLAKTLDSPDFRCAATIANQFHSWCPDWLKAADVFGLIPVWTFFAPNPGMTDYYLLYQDRLPAGSFDNWRRVELKQKALRDMVSALIRLAKDRKAEGLICRLRRD